MIVDNDGVDFSTTSLTLPEGTATEDTGKLFSAPANTVTGSGSAATAASVVMAAADGGTAGVTITPTAVTATEGGDPGSYDVVLDTPPTGTVTVDITVGAGGATAAPVTVSTSQLMFTTTGWSTAQTVTVTADDDDNPDDGTRILTHTVTGYGDLSADPVEVDTVTVTVTVTVTDRGMPPEVLLGDVPVGEGDGTATVNVMLSTAVSGALTVTLETMDGTAAAGSDYTALTNAATVEFPDGTTAAQTVAVTISDDSLVEGEETFTVGVSSVSGSVSGVAEGVDIRDTATVTITNNDDPATGGTGTIILRQGLLSTFDVRSSSFPEALGTTGTEILNVFINLDPVPAAAGFATLSLGDPATAEYGTDYTLFDSTDSAAPALGPTATVPIRSGGGWIANLLPLRITDDELDEGDETFTLSATYGAYTITPLTLTIEDNEDVPPQVTLGDASVDETNASGTVTLTATLNRPVAGGFTVPVSTADGTAIAGSDYTALSEHTLTFTGTSRETRTFTVEILGDRVVDGSYETSFAEAFTVSLGEVTGAGVAVDTGGPATVTIREDDRPPINIWLSLNPDRVNEGTATVITVTAAFPGDRSAYPGDSSTLPVDTEVAITVLDGTALLASDITSVSDNIVVTIPATMDSGTVTFNLVVAEDTLAERDGTLTGTRAEERLQVGGSIEGGGFIIDKVPLPIIDNDEHPTGIALSLDTDSVIETPGTTNVTVTATLTGTGPEPPGTRTEATVVAVSVAGGGTNPATAGNLADPGVDFTTVESFDITIPAGVASFTGTFDLMVGDDALAEGDEETVRVSGTATASGLAVTSADLTITDDDTAGVTVTPTTLTAIEEGPEQTYTVVLNSAPTGTATVTIVEDTSTTAPIAVTPATLTLTFDSSTWSTAQTVTVTATADPDAAGGTRTLEHTVTNYGSVTAADVVVTVTDNDGTSAIIWGFPAGG